ncbi:M23 family metallopeptidase [Cryobacterium sp. Sr3]|uniref:M23 family metallopeptidase n=1 Tax=Cryobacterium sp. Sr3 TaxID=1259194 RepID=UPI00106C626A|nr:M23 family metallopeptidase [Cryobacterium sp. Sr3]TFB55128.1 hypothetical protein E3N94_10290 [Cryobacterium sp. Sr3]
MNLSPRSRLRLSLPPVPPRYLATPLAAAVIVALAIFGTPTRSLADDAPIAATEDPAAAVPAVPETCPTLLSTNAPPAADPVDSVAAPCPINAPTSSSVPTLTPTPVPEPEPEPEPKPTITPTPTLEPAPAPAPTTEPTGEPTPTPTPTPTTPPASGEEPSAPTKPEPSAEPTAQVPAPAPAELTADAGSASADRAAAAVEVAQAAAFSAQQAAAAARTAEAQASAARAAAADARTAAAATQAAYDAAKLAYAGAKADYDATVVQADLVRDHGADAAARAEASRRALATLVRATLQRSGPEAVDVLLAGSSDGNDLLTRLATLESLDRLTNSLEEVQAQVDADTKRENALQDQDAALRAAIEAIPLADTRLAMEGAQQELDAASAKVADLAASTPVALVLTPLPNLVPAAGTDDFGGRLRGQPSSAGWAAPAVGSLTDAFGPRHDKPLPEVNDFHGGTDIGTACGAAVYAASAGVVATAAPLGTYGNWILINHSNGIATGYAHLAEGQTLVSVGETVIAGQVIASVGSTGASTGCHLHFEVRTDGTAVDPQPFLVQRGVQFG